MTPFSIKLPNGKQYTFSDWGDYEIYARAEFLGNQAQDVILFQAVESNDLPGGRGANCTILDTNLEQPSSLPVDNQMIVMSIQIKPDDVDSEDANGNIKEEASSALGMRMWKDVFANTFFSFTLSRSKPFAEGPIHQFPAGGGMYFQDATSAIPAATAVTVDQSYVVNNGLPSAISARLLALPIWIGTMQTFRGKLEFPRGALAVGSVAASAIIGLTTYLYGPRQRPVT